MQSNPYCTLYCSSRVYLLLVGQVLLYHAADGPVSIEVLPHGTLLVERTADGLGGSTNGSISWKHHISANADSLRSYAIHKSFLLTVKQFSYCSILRKHGCARSGCLIA